MDDKDPVATSDAVQGGPPTSKAASEMQAAAIDVSKTAGPRSGTEPSARTDADPPRFETPQPQIVVNVPPQSEKSDRWMTILTGVIAVATVVNVGIFYLESEDSATKLNALSIKAGGIVDSMNTALADNRAAINKAFQANEAAVAAANLQNKNSVAATLAAASESNRIALRAIAVSERPWIGFTAFDVKNSIEVGKYLSATATILNSGKSPALQVQVRLTARTICGDFPKVPVYPPLNEEDPGSVSTVMPNVPRDTVLASGSTPITPADMSEIRRSDCELYGYARVTYTDSLTKRPYWRHVCVQWDKSSSNSFNDCAFYNDGDEDYRDGREPSQLSSK